MVLATAFGMLPFPSAAQNFATYTVYTANNSPNRAWITIQDLGKTRNLDWGWVDAGKARVWGSGNYTLGGFFYVRYEFVDAKGNRVCDTRAQFSIAKSSSHSKIGAIATGQFIPAKGGRGCWIDITRVGPL
ncbi:MAG TPA: hypothetical protein VMG98_13695 [Verrucomicrobiae bacterium]|nr:hypothetical protein [Verrucomicrobiae bacterium]